MKPATQLPAAATAPEIYLFGCCSYEDTWRPGIQGWGATDAESRNSGYVSVPDYDELRAAYDRNQATIASLVEALKEAIRVIVIVRNADFSDGVTDALTDTLNQLESALDGAQ
jgi:hypothetical protein